MPVGDCVYEYNGITWDKFDGCSDKECEGEQPPANTFNNITGNEPVAGDTMLHACSGGPSPGFTATDYRLPTVPGKLMIVERDGNDLTAYISDAADANARLCREKVKSPNGVQGIYHDDVLNYMRTHNCFLCSFQPEFATDPDFNESRIVRASRRA